MKINKEFKVGVLVIAAIVTLYFGIDFLKGSDIFSSSNTYFVSYENADGLTRSNPVMFNGYSVGLVRRITVHQGAPKPIFVELEISKDIIIGDSAEAVLANNGLLGGKMIVLNPGSMTKSRRSDTLMGNVQPGLAALIEEKAEPMVEKVNKVLKSVDELVAAFKPTPGKVNSTLASIERLGNSGSDLVNESKADLKSITQNIEQLTTSLKTTEKDLDQLLKKMNRLGDTLNRADLAGTIHSLHTVGEQLSQTLASINSGNGTAGKLMKSDSLYHSLNTTTQSLNKLLMDMKANPKRYVHFSIFGKKEEKAGP